MFSLKVVYTKLDLNVSPVVAKNSWKIVKKTDRKKIVKKIRMLKKIVKKVRIQEKDSS